LFNNHSTPFNYPVTKSNNKHDTNSSQPTLFNLQCNTLTTDPHAATMKLLNVSTSNHQLYAALLTHRLTSVYVGLSCPTHTIYLHTESAVYTRTQPTNVHPPSRYKPELLLHAFRLKAFSTTSQQIVHLNILPWLNFLPLKSPSQEKYSAIFFFVSALSGSSFFQSYDS